MFKNSTYFRIALGENLPLLSRDGNFIKAGFDAKLDELENLEMKLKP